MSVPYISLISSNSGCVTSGKASTPDFVKSENKTPDLIKIDVEGAEIEVLTGAMALLRSSQPDLIIDGTTNIANAFLRKLGYQIYDLTDNRRVILEGDPQPYSILASTERISPISI